MSPQPSSTPPACLGGLAALQQAHLVALSRQLNASGRLHDPHRNQPTPSNHYAQTSLSLALACAGRSAQHVLQPLQAWLELSDVQRGHHPFNRLMLLLLQRHARKHGYDAHAHAAIAEGLSRCPLQQLYPSNNWGVLAQVCRILEAPERARAQPIAVLCGLIERWTTPAGAFIDYPPRPQSGGRVSTPLAYHHKVLFLAALVAHLCGEQAPPTLFAHLRRLYGWLAHCWDHNGYAGGLGRSTHALFGDACLLGALVLLGAAEDTPHSPIAALLKRLQSQQRDDGLLWLDPAGAQHGDAAWDDYMHLSVYNAWFAALLGLSLRLGALPSSVRQAHGLQWQGDRPGCFHDPVAGILQVRTAQGGSVLLSTRGQLPQTFSRDAVELRYAGGVIMHASDIHGQILAGPLARLARTALLAHPQLAGPVPILRYRKQLYGLTDFELVNLKEDPVRNVLHIELSGQALALTRKVRSGPLGRLIAALDWRLAKSRNSKTQALKRPQLKGVQASLRLRIHLDTLQCERQLEWQAPGLPAKVEWLNRGCKWVIVPSGATPPVGAERVPCALPNVYALAADTPTSPA